MHKTPLLTLLAVVTVTTLSHLVHNEPAIQPFANTITPALATTQPPADYHEPVTPTNFTATIIETKDDMHTVQLRWELPNQPHGDLIYLSLNGDRMGFLEIHRRDVIITDIPVGEPASFGLDVYNSKYDVYSDTATAVAMHQAKQPTQAPVASITCTQQPYSVPPELCTVAMQLITEIHLLLSPFGFIPPTPADQL